MRNNYYDDYLSRGKMWHKAGSMGDDVRTELTS